MVTTSDDVDDMGATPSLANAGGAGDLSLREALRIVALAPEGEIIRFDPALFPVETPSSIIIDPSLGPLPAVTVRGTVLDGGGAGVVGDDLCLSVTGSDGIVVHGNRIMNCRNGMQVSGTGQLLSGNEFVGSEQAALLLNSVFSSTVMNNDAHHNTSTRSGLSPSGISVTAGSANIRVFGNTLTFNKANGLRIDPTCRQVHAAHNEFEGNVQGAMLVELGANDAVTPPTITEFDGLVATGTTTAADGTVEIYSTDARWHAVGEAQVEQGQWSAILSHESAEVAALFTSKDGSTSNFSSTVRASGGVLLVTTTDDESDGGSGIITPGQAGGFDDLSLREAVTIANNRSGPDIIKFDTSMFAPGLETTIIIGSGAAAGKLLPGLTDAATTISSLDADVTLRPDPSLPRGTALLRVSGTASVVEGLGFGGCEVVGGHCILSMGDRVEILDNDIDCGGQPVSGIALSVSAQRNNVSGNVVRNCSVGIEVDRSRFNVFMSNTVSDCSVSGIRLDDGASTTHTATLVDNVVRNNSGAGSRCRGGVNSGVNRGRFSCRA